MQPLFSLYVFAKAWLRQQLYELVKGLLEEKSFRYLLFK